MKCKSKERYTENVDRTALKEREERETLEMLLVGHEENCDC